jgi:hypothetical protein
MKAPSGTQWIQSQIRRLPDRVTQAVKEAQGILARYVEPGLRDCENTINDLMSVLAMSGLYRR